MSYVLHQTTFCEAIKKRVRVTLRHDDDLHDRTFNPHIVYYSTKRNLLCGDLMVSNPNEPLQNGKWRTFGLDLVRSANLTQTSFTPETDFDPLNKVYRNGIVCHVRQHFS